MTSHDQLASEAPENGNKIALKQLWAEKKGAFVVALVAALLILGGAPHTSQTCCKF